MDISEKQTKNHLEGHDASSPISPSGGDRDALLALLVEGQSREAVGQLAAGIAHEINSTIQFIGDNLNFFSDISKEMILRLDASGGLEPDLAYLKEELPRAIDQSIDGVRRIASMIRAMKEFSRRGYDDDFVAVDINKSIRNALAISRNEWKYTADSELDLAPDLPAIECVPFEVNHAILTLIVLAANAVRDATQRNSLGESAMGRIRVATRAEGKGIRISVSHTGLEMSEDAWKAARLPFTAENGMDQFSLRLSLACETVVGRHCGSMEMEHGTCFHIWLPGASET